VRKKDKGKEEFLKFVVGNEKFSRGRRVAKARFRVWRPQSEYNKPDENPIF